MKTDPAGTGFARDLRVVIAHDYITQRGGAERVVLALCRAYPRAKLVTSIYNPDTSYPEFRDIDITTSALNGVAMFRRDPRRAFPLLASTWSRLDAGDADVVLCSSAGWSHAVRTQAPKVVYCHNPARWLYQPQEYLVNQGVAVRTALRLMSGPLRRWDRAAASSAAVYAANSRSVATRIRGAYGLEAEVVLPPAMVDPSGPVEEVRGIATGYFLTVGRPRGYKNTAVVVDAFADLPGERLVVVGGLPPGEWPSNLRGLVDVSDAQMRWLYANAAGLVACSFEDFGLTPVEAYAFGIPAAVLRAGGYLDSSLPGVTGVFIEEPSAGAVCRAVEQLRAGHFPAAAIRSHAESFSEKAFRDKVDRLVDRALDGYARPPGLTLGRGPPD